MQGFPRLARQDMPMRPVRDRSLGCLVDILMAHLGCEGVETCTLIRLTLSPQVQCSLAMLRERLCPITTLKTPSRGATSFVRA